MPLAGNDTIRMARVGPSRDLELRARERRETAQGEADQDHSWVRVERPHVQVGGTVRQSQGPKRRWPWSALPCRLQLSHRLHRIAPEPQARTRGAARACEASPKPHPYWATGATVYSHLFRGQRVTRRRGGARRRLRFRRAPGMFQRAPARFSFLPSPPAVPRSSRQAQRPYVTWPFAAPFAARSLCARYAPLRPIATDTLCAIASRRGPVSGPPSASVS